MRRGSVVVVGAVLIFASIAAEAGPLPSRTTTGGVPSDQELAVLEALLETRMVQATLGRLGVTPDEVKDRLSRLSPSERHQLAARAELVLAGGQDRVTLLIVIILLLILVALLI